MPRESHSLLSLDAHASDFTHEPVATARAATPASRPARTPIKWPWGALLPLLFLTSLEIGAALDLIPSRLLPPPSEVAHTIFTLASRDLFAHIAISSARVAAGFAIGAALAIVFGVLVGMHRRAERLLEPSFQALRAIPSLAWIPLLLLWLGIDETPKIALIAIGAFFPVYVNLVAGIHNIDRKLIEVGKILGMSSRDLIRRVLIPAALPQLFTGLRTGLSMAWMFLVAAELIAATKGVGYLLSDGRESSRPDIVLAAIIILATLGKLSDSLLKRIETRQLRWRDVLATQS